MQCLHQLSLVSNFAWESVWQIIMNCKTLFCSILTTCISQFWSGQNPEADTIGKQIVCLHETGEKIIFPVGGKEGQIKNFMLLSTICSSF